MSCTNGGQVVRELCHKRAHGIGIALPFGLCLIVASIVSEVNCAHTPESATRGSGQYQLGAMDAARDD